MHANVIARDYVLQEISGSGRRSLRPGHRLCYCVFFQHPCTWRARGVDFLCSKIVPPRGSPVGSESESSGPDGPCSSRDFGLIGHFLQSNRCDKVWDVQQF